MATTGNQDSRRRNISFVATQRGKEIPVIDDYLFVCKDKERKRFRCRTRGCSCTITLSVDEKGPFYRDPRAMNVLLTTKSFQR